MWEHADLTTSLRHSLKRRAEKIEDFFYEIRLKKLRIFKAVLDHTGGSDVPRGGAFGTRSRSGDASEVGGLPKRSGDCSTGRDCLMLNPTAYIGGYIRGSLIL